jgi:hypothetical protein
VERVWRTAVWEASDATLGTAWDNCSTVPTLSRALQPGNFFRNSRRDNKIPMPTTSSPPRSTAPTTTSSIQGTYLVLEPVNGGENEAQKDPFLVVGRHLENL